MKVYFIAILIILTSLVSPTGATVYECKSCSDCSQKIQNTIPGDIVILTVDIIDQDGTCIEFNGTDGIIFDGNGHLISGDSDLSGYGIHLSSNSDNNIIKNCEINDFFDGVYFFCSDNNSIENIRSTYNRDCGIYFVGSNSNNIKDIEVGLNNQCGFYLVYGSCNTLTNIISVSNSIAGIYINNCSSTTVNDSHITDNNIGIKINGDDGNEANLIYNNYFNNENNINFTGTVNNNIWNINPMSGKNIIGGLNIAGNYWSGPSGQGFSRTCTDSNRDGICDESYELIAGNIDYFPLTNVYVECGDLDASTIVDDDDIQLLFDHIFTGTPVYEYAADVDGRNNVNILDARLLMNYIFDSNTYQLNCE